MQKRHIAKIEPKNEIVVYQPDEVMRLEVRVLDESVWLTQAQIAELFGTKRPAITKHLTNIYKTGELERDGTCSILEHMGHDGVQQYRTAYYNLDAILAVGYRVNSRDATQFRRWASSVLKEYLLRGYAFNARMNQLEDKVDRRLASHEKRLAAVEQGIDFVVKSNIALYSNLFCGENDVRKRRTVFMGGIPKGSRPCRGAGRLCRPRRGCPCRRAGMARTAIRDIF